MTFSVATYNVLADAYIHASRYPGVAASLLTPEQRQPRLLKRIASLAADLLCLQEIEAQRLQWLLERLQPLGYEGYFAQKSNHRPDGCAILFRSAVVHRLQTGFFRFAAPKALSQSSGDVAIVLVARIAGATVGITTSHIRWDAPGTAPDAQYSLSEIEQWMGYLKQAFPEVGSWVLTGDLNAEADSLALKALFAGGFEDAAEGSAPGFTSYTAGRLKRIDFILHTALLRVTDLALPTLSAEHALPSLEEPSDHVPLLARFA